MSDVVPKRSVVNHSEKKPTDRSSEEAGTFSLPRAPAISLQCRLLVPAGRQVFNPDVA
jgi:hypothetical protein